jgi:hypothetical protein
MRMTEAGHFRQIDEPVYHDELAPYLPQRILDAHVHLIRRSDFLPGVDPRKLKTTAPEPIATSFTPRHLAATMRRLFPRQTWEAFIFTPPTPWWTPSVGTAGSRLLAAGIGIFTP